MESFHRQMRNAWVTCQIKTKGQNGDEKMGTLKMMPIPHICTALGNEFPSPEQCAVAQLMDDFFS